MNSGAVDVSVILVSWNTRDLLIDCLASLPVALGTLRADVWVVDNASSDDSVAAVRARHPAVKLIVDERNMGYAVAANRAIAASTGRYLLLLNRDTLPQPGSIQRLMQFADTRTEAAVIPQAGMRWKTERSSSGRNRPKCAINWRLFRAVSSRRRSVSGTAPSRWMTACCTCSVSF